MTTKQGLAPTVGASLYRAAARATLAPSIHNTQPWRFVVRPGRLELRSDPSRRLSVLDPSGRQVAISCGAALFGVRVALAAAQLDVVTSLLPEPGSPDLLATVTVAGATREPALEAQRLDAAADVRHSNRRQFTPDVLPDTVIELLTHAAQIEGALLQPIRTEPDRVMVAVQSQRADALQNADQSYRVELRAWTHSDPSRRDGVPADAFAHITGPSHDDVPIRDFDTEGLGELSTEAHERRSQSLFVLATSGDGLKDWLVAGQALGRVLLELTVAGYVASILSQVVEEPSTRQGLRDGLRLSGYPDLLLRVGTAETTPASPRRELADVITSDFPIPDTAGAIPDPAVLAPDTAVLISDPAVR